jgi:autotransporter-associated beta strand protein
MMRRLAGIGTSSVQLRTRMLPVAAGAAVALGSLAGSALGQATWIGNTTASPDWSFSNNANWLGNSAPLLGTVTTPVNLTFFSGNGGGITASNDLGSPWVAHSLTFNTFNAGTFTLTGGSAAGQFQLVGPSAAINQNGIGSVTIANGTVSPNWGAQIQLAGNMTFGGTGIGNVTLGTNNTVAAVSQDSTPRSITISGGSPLRVLRNLVLKGANSFSGGLILDGGTVQGGAPSNAAEFGSAGSTMTVTANGGTINLANTFTSLSLGTLQLNGDLHVIGTQPLNLSNGTTSAPAVVQGPGTLYINAVSPGGMTISGNSSGFTGAVVIDQSEFGLGAAGVVGGLTLNTVNFGVSPVGGALTGATSYDVRASGTLTADSSATGSFQNGNRISDTAPMRLRTGNFALNGPAAAATSGNIYPPTNLTERIGPVTGAGNSTVSVSAGTGAVVTTLQAASLTRLDRGTFVLRGTALGDGATTPRGKFILDTPVAPGDFVGGGGGAGSQNINILPYAVGGTSANDSGSSLVTYGSDGFRLLTSAEYYITDVAPSDTTANVLITGAVANSASQTMNALVLGSTGSGGTDGSVTGNGTLHVTSGAVLQAGVNGSNTSNQQTIENNLAFGGAEAVISTGGSGGLRVTGQLTGTNGLTKSGNGSGTGGVNVLVLTNDNSGLTGPLTLSAGSLQYTQDLALPGTGQIIANGAGAIIGRSAATFLFWGNSEADTTLSRNVAVHTGTMNFAIYDTAVAANAQVSMGNMHLTGTISGAGSVNFQGQVASGSITTPGEIYVDNPANTYTGTTRFAGNTHIAADGSTGIGGGWDFPLANAAATLYFESPVTNSRPINIDSGSGVTFDTKANSVTLNGPVTTFTGWGAPAASAAGLTKNGTGTLTFTNAANTLAGQVMINAGKLVINGNLGPGNGPGAGTAGGNVQVNPGATLGGSGTIYRNVRVYSPVSTNLGGGTLSPGNGNIPGILTIGGAPVGGGTPVAALDMAAPQPGTFPQPPASTLVMKLNGPVAGTGYDQVQVISQNANPAPAVQLGGDTFGTQPTNLILSLGFAPAANSVFWLITNTNNYQANLGTANTTTGAFNGLLEGATVSLGTFGGVAFTGTISYAGDYATNNPTAGTGNDVVIYNVHGGCGTADFNCDGDTGTDADIEAFFACLSGTCPPPPCASSADFNGDGDVGTDSDIEAFFRVLGGGTC